MTPARTRPASQKIKNLILELLERGPVSIAELRRLVPRDAREIRRARVDLASQGKIIVSANGLVSSRWPSPYTPSVAMPSAQSGIVSNQALASFYASGHGSELVYALVDPRDAAFFYVGRTSKPGARLKKHRKSARDGEGTPRTARIREILARGLQPFMFPLASLPPASHRDARVAAENWWMETFERLGACLTNAERATR